MSPLDLILAASANDHMIAATTTLSAVAIVIMGRTILIMAVRAFQPRRPADGNGSMETRS